MGGSSSRHSDGFGLEPGRKLLDKYEVVSLLGRGWEGEVYKVRETSIGAERAAKFFFPQRNVRNRAAKFYARKLHKLRECGILIQYHTQERIVLDGEKTTFLVSEFVEGKILKRYLATLPGRRMTPFEGLHFLHALAAGVERIHLAREYHGDLHYDNVMLRRRGLGFRVKIVDLYNWGKPSAENILDDVCDLVRIFYDAVGGAPHYAKQPPEVKAICNGLKRSLIAKKFRTAGRLRQYLETMGWTNGD